MDGIWISSLRAAMLFAMAIIALLAFAAAPIGTVGGIPNGEHPDVTVAAAANRDTPGFVDLIPGQSAVGMQQNFGSNDRELGAWLLMIFGFGAVAFTLRCRRSEPARHQFV